ncbi:MAG TPA: transcriptional regulator, partial [Allosphingosinicella sp.]|nr:transcriptional regulator [Allosphingosinicella sp.]
GRCERVAKADEIIHQSLRLRIMAALHAARAEEGMEFNRLKALVGATDGNLGSHLGTLEGVGYIALTKDFVGKKPRTRAAITRAGERAFRDHRDYLRDVIEGGG